MNNESSNRKSLDAKSEHRKNNKAEDEKNDENTFTGDDASNFDPVKCIYLYYYLKNILICLNFKYSIQMIKKIKFYLHIMF